MSEQEIRMVLAAKLKEYREKAGLSIKEAGDAIGKSDKTISAWEHGRGQPDADMLFVLCNLYGIKNISVFYGIETNTNLSPDENELLRNYRAADDEGKQHIQYTARLAANNPPALRTPAKPAI